MVGDGTPGAEGLARGVDQALADGATLGAADVRERLGATVPEGVRARKEAATRLPA